jgi:hypothetical protein
VEHYREWPNCMIHLPLLCVYLKRYLYYLLHTILFKNTRPCLTVHVPKTELLVLSKRTMSFSVLSSLVFYIYLEKLLTNLII